MLKKLALISLTVSSACFASEDKREGSGKSCKPKGRYLELVNEYKDVSNDPNLSQEEKVDIIIDVTEEMRMVVVDDDCYMNQDYNDCMRESNAQQRGDYARCERNGNKDSCYDRADKNNDHRRAACERVGHSDNVKEVVESVSNTNKGDKGGRGSRGGKEGGRISAADRRR